MNLLNSYVSKFEFERDDTYSEPDQNKPLNMNELFLCVLSTNYTTKMRVHLGYTNPLFIKEAGNCTGRELHVSDVVGKSRVIFCCFLDYSTCTCFVNFNAIQ